MARTNKTIKDLRPCIPDLLDKESGVYWYIDNYMRMINRMIDYPGLPEDIPRDVMVDWLQRIGFIAFTDKADGTPRFFYGGLYYDPEDYYPTRPKAFQFNHPKFNERLDIGEECFLLRHDSKMLGFERFLIRYAAQQVEADISLRTALINSRVQNILTSGDNTQVEAANKYFKDIEAGKLSALLDVRMVDCLNGLKDIAQGRPTRPVTEILEVEQYLHGKALNGVGLNQDFNMKREQQNEAEAGMNDDCLMPTVDDVVETQRADFEKINAAYGWKVRPDISSAWKHRRVFMEAELEAVESESEQPDEQPAQDQEPEEKEGGENAE